MKLCDSYQVQHWQTVSSPKSPPSCSCKTLHATVRAIHVNPTQPMQAKEQLRAECSRLFELESLTDSLELLDVYIELVFQIIKKHRDEPVYTSANADAKIVIQMVMTKALSIKSVITGFAYQAKDGSGFKQIIDPTILACLLRNLFETVAMFNLIYRDTKSEDEKHILYNLWVHAGLKYRQRFETIISTVEEQQKIEEEKLNMEKLIQSIEETELFKRLSEKNQGKVKTRIKDKEYLMRFEGEEVMFLHWQELTKVMQIKPGLFDHIYTYFSLYSHPSNVSVFQFAAMFKKGNEKYPWLTNFNMTYCFALLSLFIADFLKLFPTAQKTFDEMHMRDQIVIDFYNTSFRGNAFQINESWKGIE